MDKLTVIKIKYKDGTYSDQIPVSVLGENVEWDATHTLVDILGSIDVDITGTIQDQISRLFNEKVSASTLQSYVANQLNTDVTNWLNTNVNPVGSAVVVDKTLTITGAAADAKIVGEEISNLNTFFSTKRLSSSNVFGYFTNTTLQYWDQTAHVIAYIPCEPNKKYQITKDVETLAFSLAYIKEAPQKEVQQPVYNYIALNGTLDNKIDYLTGEDAQYLLVLLGQVNISLASHVYFYTFEIEQLNELDERITEIEEQNLNSRLNTIEQNLFDYVTDDIYESLSWTDGYMRKDGVTQVANTLQYSNKISVQSGDVVNFESTSFANFRFITAFTNNTAIYNLGVENVKTYTIPKNINYIVVTTYKKATDVKIFHTHKSLINVSELKNDVNELKEDNIEIQENINILNTDINALKKEVQEVLSGTYGFFNDTQLIYWRQSGNYIVYFKCKPNYKYRIQKNISSNLFKICYIKQEPAPNFAQSIFNLKVYSESSTDIDIYYETGDDALYLLMLIGVQTEAEDIIIQNNIRVSSKQVMIIDEEARHIITYNQAYLPRNLYLLKNTDYEIFHAQICPKAENYTFKWSAGNNYGNRVRLNYDTVGNKSLSCSIYHADGSLAKQLTTIVHVVEKTNNNISLLPFGDSLTNHCVWESELMNMAENLTCVGSRGRDVRDSDGELRSVSDEGRAGFTSFNYTSGSGYGSGASDRGGVESPNNRWYDPTNQQFSTQYYFDNYFPSDQTIPNVITVFLGMNDLLGTHTVEEIVANMQLIIEDMIAYNNSISIVLMSPQLRYLPSLNGHEYLLFLEYAKQMENMASNYDNVVFLPLLIGMDSTNNYNLRTISINTRSSITEQTASDITHPADVGYWQIADYVLGAISYLAENN